MLFTGQPITAHEAKNHGLVSRVVPAAELDQQLDEIVRVMSTRSLDTLVLGKYGFWKHSSIPDLADAYAFGGRVMVENMMLGSAKKGVDGFLKKEKVEWERD